MSFHHSGPHKITFRGSHWDSTRGWQEWLPWEAAGIFLVSHEPLSSWSLGRKERCGENISKIWVYFSLPLFIYCQSNQWTALNRVWISLDLTSEGSLPALVWTLSLLLCFLCLVQLGRAVTDLLGHPVRVSPTTSPNSSSKACSVLGSGAKSCRNWGKCGEGFLTEDELSAECFALSAPA